MHQAVPERLFSVMPNAGWPEQVGGRIQLPRRAGLFWRVCPGLLGIWRLFDRRLLRHHTSPYRSMARAIENTLSIEQLIPEINLDTVKARRPHCQPPCTHPPGSKTCCRTICIAVEMDPPRGLSTHKLLAGASLLAEAGADVIDVADSPMARMRISPWAVCNLIQRQLEY